MNRVERKADRYQYQSWYIKLWRRRHYISIPLSAWKMYWANMEVDRAARHTRQLSWSNAWSIAIGLAQAKMNWLHDWSEIRRKLDGK